MDFTTHCIHTGIFGIIRKVHAYAVASDFCEALCARGATDISPTF